MQDRAHKTIRPMPSRTELRAIRLRELREKAAAEGNTEAMFPTAPPDYTLRVVVPVAEAPIETPAPAEGEPVTEGRLATLAHEINTRFTLADRLDNQANDHRLAAAIQLAEAQRVCAAVKLNFKAWCEAHVPKSYLTIKGLVRVGSAPDPRLALEDLRGKNQAINIKWRAKKAAEQEALVAKASAALAPSSPAPAVSSAEAAVPEPATEQGPIPPPSPAMGKPLAGPVDVLIDAFLSLSYEDREAFLVRATELMMTVETEKAA